MYSMYSTRCLAVNCNIVADIWYVDVVFKFVVDCEQTRKIMDLMFNTLDKKSELKKVVSHMS